MTVSREKLIDIALPLTAVNATSARSFLDPATATGVVAVVALPGLAIRARTILYRRSDNHKLQAMIQSYPLM